jgi:hypothetical protein
MVQINNTISDNEQSESSSENKDTQISVEKKESFDNDNDNDNGSDNGSYNGSDNGSNNGTMTPNSFDSNESKQIIQETLEKIIDTIEQSNCPL